MWATLCLWSHLLLKYKKVTQIFPMWQVELGFRSGDIIYVLGDMDQDGFYYVSVIIQFLCNDCCFALITHKLNFPLNFRGICMDDEGWYHLTFCSRCPGIRQNATLGCFWYKCQVSDTVRNDQFYKHLMCQTIYFFIFILQYGNAFALDGKYRGVYINKQLINPVLIRIL